MIAMNTKLLRSTKDCTPIEIFLSVTSKPCPHPRTYKNRNAKPDVNCSMLVTTNILHIQWFNAMALFCRCCLLLPVFRKSVLCLSRVLGVLAWRAGYSSHGGRRYVVCSSRQRPAPFDWRRMLTVPPLLANCPAWRAGSTASPAASPHPSQLISPGLLIGRLHCSADVQACLQFGRFSTPLLFSGQRPQLQSWTSGPMAVCLPFRAD